LVHDVSKTHSTDRVTEAHGASRAVVSERFSVRSKTSLGKGDLKSMGESRCALKHNIVTDGHFGNRLAKNVCREKLNAIV
jgi:hypothetical protein